MNFELKHISHAFRTDAYHLLNKAITAFEHSSIKTRTGFQAKIVVDLFMSIECSLKSLMCSKASALSGEASLRNIFRYGHDLKRLMKSADIQSLNSEDTKFIYDLNKRGVRLRYDLDLFSLLTSDLLKTDTVNFHITPQYVTNLARIAEALCDQAQEQHKSQFTDEPRLVTQGQIDKEVRELRALMIRARKKKPKKS